MIMPVVMMVPNMLTLKTFGLLNTLTGVMMPYFTSAFGVFLMRQAFLAIPKELEEAALMEGCRWWQVLFRVLLPMSSAVGAGLRHRQHYLPLERVPVAADDAQRSR